MIVLSYSSSRTYLDCPKKYEFHYIEKLPRQEKYFFSFGQSIHKAIEFFYKDSKTGEIRDVGPTNQDFIHYFLDNWSSQGYRGERQESEFLEKGKYMLEKWYAQAMQYWQKPIAVEYQFGLYINRIPVIGAMDLVFEDANTITIVDFKTGQTLQPDRIAKDKQMLLYQIAAKRLWPGKRIKLVLFHVPTLGTQICWERSESDENELINEICGVYNNIVMKQFEPTPTPEKCKWCDFKSKCPALRCSDKGEF